ncbi:histone-binding protein MSI1 homolog [Oryza glaberrima]|uniref:histone-binding protein MSI1 homolog n=1 Tax=Oryza glaberrima TaxID=4538 RepID=UPI00224C2298|nr:histone-binding protein MSI1 homolog [Oryza glaberrima]
MEEHQSWKKNAPVLYDLVMSQLLKWPTHTSDETPKHLLLADATLPLLPRLAAGATAAGGAVPASSVSISRSVPHKGEVNRARCMPQRRYMVATKTCVDEVHVYHLGDDGEKSSANVVLRGHEAEGYGLAPAQSTAPFQVSIFTSRSTTTADVPTRQSAGSPSRG